MATKYTNMKLGDFQVTDGTMRALRIGLAFGVAMAAPCISSIRMKPQGPRLLHFDDLMSKTPQWWHPSIEVRCCDQVRKTLDDELPSPGPVRR